MVSIVTHANRAAYAATVAQMHRDRKSVFVDTLKWSVPVVDGQFEIDEYDTDDAVYLIADDPRTGVHLGSVRLVCTDGPHLLGDKFGFLCEAAVPAGADVWEITRLCTKPGLAAAAALAVRMQLVLALIEYGLANGIARYTMMTHTAYLPTLLAVGWDIAPLGLPAAIEGEPVGALEISVTPDTLPRLRRMYGFRHPVLAGFELPALAA